MFVTVAFMAVRMARLALCSDLRPVLLMCWHTELSMSGPAVARSRRRAQNVSAGRSIGQAAGKSMRYDVLRTNDKHRDATVARYGP
jgi:hypothetical protein